MQKRHFFYVILLGVLTVLTTIAFYLPASWVGLALEKQTKGRVTLGDIQGSFWSGSAFVGVAADHYSPVTPLFPGRFSWKISPAILLGQLAVEIHNPQVLNTATQLNGNFSQWRLSPASLNLPPERLEGLGAPLNTIGPTGKIVLRWSELEFAAQDGSLLLNGKMQLELNEMASRLSSIRPLGSYALDFQWRGDAADLNLSTSRGPMMLDGKGALRQGRFQFSGKAYAETGQEEKMASLLNLLGRRRQEGDKQVIALEYK